MCKLQKKYVSVFVLGCLLSSSAVFSASAVAWSEEAYGFAFNLKTVEEAEALAKERAKKNGGENIEILASSDIVGYGAIAVDGNIIGVTLGYPDLRTAMTRAKQECVKKGGRFPRVVATWHDRGY